PSSCNINWRTISARIWTMPSIELHSTKKTESRSENATRSGSPAGVSDRVHFGIRGASWQRLVPALVGLTRVQLPPRPGVLTLSAVLLLGLSALLACCTAQPRSQLGDF